MRFGLFIVFQPFLYASRSRADLIRGQLRGYPSQAVCPFYIYTQQMSGFGCT